MEHSDYCRQIESYLCQKNDGHLIRVVGPSFELVTQWAADGVPLKVVFRGIDQYFERYYRKGPRRRPVRVDFCEADVLDVFDEWRRALGLTRMGTGQIGNSNPDNDEGSESPRSLPAHLQRVLVKLTNARATGALAAEADEVIDRIARELEVARGSTRGLRGASRIALIDRLVELDLELQQIALAATDEITRQSLGARAEDELAAFRQSMPTDSYARAREAAIANLARERLALPTLTFK